MKISKIASIVAAAAMAVSAVAVSASATDWSKAGYADNNPDTCVIVSTDENSLTFTAPAGGQQVKARITAGDVLDNPELVRSATWTVTYTIADDATGGWLGGACYFGCKNSTGYSFDADYDEDGNPYFAEKVKTATDDAKFLLPTEALAADSELVFMDWSSFADINKINITISDLKFFDADGNEIAQKPYSGAAAEAAPAETTEEAAPAADNTTTAASTGNAAVASIAAVMAAAGVAAIAAKKRK